MILATLMGLLLPVLAIAQRAADKSATRSVMVKVDTALRLFRSEIGSYPYKRTYEDLAGGADWTNRLYYHLGTNIAQGDYAKVLADAKSAANLYLVNIPPSAFAFIDADYIASAKRMLNNMGAERARLAIFSGNIDVVGPVLRTPWIRYGTSTVTPRRVMPTTPLLLTAVSESRPGWAKDYLKGELEQRYISGEAILDAWKRPIIYVGQVIEGMESSQRTVLRSIDFGLSPIGRRSLALADAITGLPLVVDAAKLPDLSNLRHSDRRYYAAPGLELEFELWSAGPDGRAGWMRDDDANRDNLPLYPYDTRIP